MICRAIPYEGKEPYIFLSYCHKDAAMLYPVFEQMVLDGYRLWYDDGNYAGDDWLDNIENHLEDCHAVVAFISDHSSLSHNCKSEIVYSIKCKKKIIPVLVDSADLPKGLRLQLSHLHHLRRTDYPSDKDLLNKIYETKECSECKAPAGQLQLKPGIVPKTEIASPISIDSTPVKTPHIEKSAGVIPGENTSQKTDDKNRRVVKITSVIRKLRPVENDPDPEQDAPKETPVPKTNEPQDMHESVPAVIPTSCTDNGESTCVSIDPIDDEKTVYEQAPAYTPAHEDLDPDDDVTVRINNRVLAILLHPAAERAYTLKKPQTKIGRSPIKCDVVIEGNETVSKLHAEIRQYNQKFFLVDSNSANGTYINGEQLEAGKQIPLDTPAVFQLNDENLILITGAQARNMVGKKSIALLMNEKCSAVRILEKDTMPLNRNSKWSDGTLADLGIHRAAHALLNRKEDGVYLVDESPHNATYLNGDELNHGGSRLLHSGDQIKLGDTTLHFVLITI